jgi:uncharacterized protein with HEPN domain
MFTNSDECDIPTQSIIDGINLCVYRVAEEANSLSEDFKKDHPDIAWNGIRGLRNIVAHAYGVVNPSIIWETIQSDFPRLESLCQSYAEERGLILVEYIALD